MNEPELLLLWGKTCRDKNDPDADLKYHPLLFHLFDVAHCADILWKECLSARVKERLASALGLEDEATARRAVLLLAALHDLGKATPGFQLQVSAPLFLRPRLEAAGWKQEVDTCNKPHSLISAFDLNSWISSGKWVWTSPAGSARILAHAVGAHHGTFPSVGDMDFGEGVLGGEDWCETRRALADQVIAHLDLEPSFVSGEIEDAGAIAILSGLLAVADWLGSSYFFPHAAHRDKKTVTIAEYKEYSQQQSRKAMEKFGWLPGVQWNRQPLDFASFFEFDPNPLQEAMIREAAQLASPFLAIAEAPMGAGKTEAAFAGIDAALTQGRANGFYFALPTQATGNALHDRVRDDYLGKGRHKGNLNLQLVHGGALLKEDLVIRQGAIWDETDEQPTVAAQSWFTNRKQSLLAPFGVGTIDQSLTGVLQTKHWFVRLFGLAGKVVVFDEVHAYDTYMNTLLKRLITWLRALDCSVILLSATLPSSRRHELLRAWGATPPADEAKYPRLTWADEGNNQNARSIPLSMSASDKTITLCPLSTDVQALVAELRDKLREGGCACVICNTVARAQNTFETLRAELGADFGQWYLLHARLPFAWRQKRETEILAAFGKKKDKRPPRAIVVATQVIEQSLDLDFDWMATELAPIDLILQRAGRLHRHTHDENKLPLKRPVPLQSPELAVRCDETAGLPNLDVPDEMYSHFILLRSYWELRSRAALQLPGDIETLIEAVYEGELAPDDAAWQDALKKTGKQLQASHKAARSKARGFSAPAPDDAETVCEAPSRELRDDDDPATGENRRAATRDGDPSIQCICLIRTSDGLFLPDEHGNADLSHPVDLDETPDRNLTRALLRCGVPISGKSLFHTLLAHDVPPGWRENAHLRFARELIFENGLCAVGSKKLQLHRDLGVKIIKEPSGENL